MYGHSLSYMKGFRLRIVRITFLCFEDFSLSEKEFIISLVQIK